VALRQHQPEAQPLPVLLLLLLLLLLPSWWRWYCC
jgi:hypothetical protein